MNIERVKTPLLTAKNIQKFFSRPERVDILKGVSLDIFPGESVAIMGRSGEGKSTLLHILGTLEAPNQGSLVIAGHEISVFNKNLVRNRHIGFIFQAFHLLEDCSALENVLMPAWTAREPVGKGSQAYKRACSLLEQVQLSHRVDFNVKLLSGGEKQRVAIARALCNDPDIILADEPTGNLDSQNSQLIQELLFQCVNKEQKALVIVTHDHQLASL